MALLRFAMRAALYLADPYAHYRRLRAAGPIHWNPSAKVWVLTRYADIASALSHPALSSRRLGLMRDHAEHDSGRRVDSLENRISSWLIRMDPPEHTRLRGLASHALNARLVESARPQIQDRAERLLDVLLARPGDVDFISEYAVPLTLAAICDLLGLPEEDHRIFQHWATRIGHSAGAAGSPADDGHAIEALDAARACLEARMADQSTQGGLIEALSKSSDRVVSADDIVSICTLLLLAGHETTSHLLANALLALFNNPPELHRFRSGDGDAGALGELMRYDTPLQGILRQAARDCEIAGQGIAEGERVVLWLASANRDPAVFADPERLALTRKAAHHASFGFGIHRCLGAHLANCIVRLGLATFFRLAPNAAPSTRTIEWKGNMLFRHQTALRVQLNSR
jgi:cytochrome P450